MDAAFWAMVAPDTDMRGMRALAAEGLGIVFVTSDLDEVMSLSDRIIVMSEGRISATFPVGADPAAVAASAAPRSQEKAA